LSLGGSSGRPELSWGGRGRSQARRHGGTENTIRSFRLIGLFERPGEAAKLQFDFEFNFDIVGAMAWFDPDKMAVYRLARQHSRAVRDLIDIAETKGFSDLINQFRRSTVSIPANLLEAFGEWRLGKRHHYLLIAKGSAWESWSHADAMVDFGLVPAAAIAEVRDVQQQITALLIATIRNLEAAMAEDPKNPI
jgi:four helix bundle protein